MRGGIGRRFRAAAAARVDRPAAALSEEGPLSAPVREGTLGLLDQVLRKQRNNNSDYIPILGIIYVQFSYLLIFTEHEAVLNLGTGGDVVKHLQLLQEEVVRQVHVGDALLRVDGELTALLVLLLLVVLEVHEVVKGE